MAMNLVRSIIGIALGVLLFAGPALTAESAEVEKFVKARIDIGEMMTNYSQVKEGERPSPEQMREMGEDINAKLGKLLAKYDLTLEDYRQRSSEVFANEAAVKGYLNEHQDLKARYDALPFDRMGRGGSGRAGARGGGGLPP